MAKFITDSDLNAALEKLIKEATASIILISPFIKLHERIKSELLSKKNDPHIEIRVVFGKNEENPNLSLRPEDLNFFKDFPNVDIRYEKRLHAKYYANEVDAILTSMNLYTVSQDNNIEFGILLKTNLVKSLIGASELDAQAWEYFNGKVFEQAKPVFKRKPTFEGNIFKKTYKGSQVEVDNTSTVFQEKSFVHKEHPQEPRVKKESKPSGYCIRTGKPIPFNPDRPLNEEAYKSWSQFSNRDYPEKFCHFSGEPSNGDTTFAKPILRKNWSKAKEIHGI